MCVRRGAPEIDAIVVGSGPNGLAAAVTLARAGLSVRVYERAAHVGGGAATAELTLPGFHHDVCSAVHPMALASEFFRRFGSRAASELVVPEVSYGHPLPGGPPGWPTGASPAPSTSWAGTARPGTGCSRRWWRTPQQVAEFTGDQLLRVPRHPVTAAAIRPARARSRAARSGTGGSRGDAAPALLTGVSAHTIRALPSIATAGAGLTLATYAHAGGWPIPVGGSGAIVTAMVDDLLAHGGEIVTSTEVRRLRDLPPARVVLLDVTPRALLRLAEGELPAGYAGGWPHSGTATPWPRSTSRCPDPVPWRAAGLRAAGTVHVGGTRAQIRRAENTVARGGMRASRMCWSPSPAAGTPAGRRPADTRSGRTLTCRAAPRSTRPRRSSARSSGTRPDSATRSSPTPSRTALRMCRRTTRTTSAATSRPAR